MTDETAVIITATPNPRAVPGDNVPPSPIDDLPAQMQQRTAKLMARAGELMAAAPNCVVHDDDTVADAGDLAKMIGAAVKAANEAHTDTKKPFLQGGRMVDDFFRPLRDGLLAAKDNVLGKITQYQNEERERLAAEQRRREAIEREERRKVDEAAAQAAADSATPEMVPEPTPAPPPAPPPAPAKVRTEFGTTIGSTGRKVATVTNYDEVWPAVRDNTKVREAIDKAVAAMVRGGNENIPGVKIDTVHQARV